MPARNTSATYAEYTTTSASPPRNSSVPISNGPNPTVRLLISPAPPNPIRNSHRINGTPRTMSTYKVANRRSGNRTGDRTPRASASVMPHRTISGTQTTKIRRSSRNARRMGGNVSANVWASKNVSRTRSHPSSCGTPQMISPRTAAVLAPARTNPRSRWRRSYSARRVRLTARRYWWASAGRDDRRVGEVAHPLRRDRLELAAVLQRRQRHVDALGERAVLGQQQAPLLGAAAFD